MGNVGSRIGEGDGLFLRDQTKFSVASLSIVNSRNRTLLNITPNSFPATRYTVKRDLGDDSVVEYVQDPESVASGGPPSFLLRLANDDDLTFKFTFILRQGPAPPSIYTAPGTTTPVTPTSLVDAVINGLTFVFASTSKEVENLVTREFHADPNLHKNPNVYLLGDYSTGGSQSVQFTWNWKWKAPKNIEDRGGGWRNSCSFVEYNQRAHRLDTLASFSFWVQNVSRPLTSPKSPSPRIELGVPPRLRVPSTQSIESRVSDSDANELKDAREPASPAIETIPENALALVPVETAATTSTEATKVNIDISCQRPGEDLSQVDDGPVFRATMKSLEQKTGNMRTRWKRVLRSAEAAREAHIASNNAFQELMDSLRGASNSNANAVQPAIDHYFDKIAKEILAYEKLNTQHIQKLIIDPISRLYNVDIKQAEAKKEEFERETKEYYQYVGRYLGQRQDSLKEKKRVETDSKYQFKRRNFELKRFDYSSFMQDLHGGRKDQEILSSLTRFADAQARGYLETAKRIEAMVPQLEALSSEVKEVDKEFQLQRTEREEKRRALEKSTKTFKEPDGTMPPSTANGQTTNGSLPQRSSSLMGGGYKGVMASMTSSQPTEGSSPPSAKTQATPSNHTIQSAQQQAAAGAGAAANSPASNKFKGIRDLEDKDPAAAAAAASSDGTGVQQHRKEGLLWALSRPGSHVDPKGFNKQAWHKFWIVLDQGKLSEYENWKDKPDLHMDPIDLRMASVREARGAERRFCFEVITPQFTRVYQATSEDDMRSWISSINNALQSAVEGKGMSDAKVNTESLPGSTRRDIASVLTGKSTSVGHRSSYQPSSKQQPVSRHATVGDRPSSYRNAEPRDEDSDKLLRRIREADASNRQCADCGSESKVEWVSINLGIVVCIDCSGIHRSLGTHISKIRSLTLDTHSFTPDVLEILLTIGNRISNTVWEARLTDRTVKPGPFSTREQRFHFISAKYKDRAFVQPLSPTLSQYGTPEDTLLASIKKNDIQSVLYAMAIGASLNATDRSRNAPAIFLALSAADPASPSSHSSPLASPGLANTTNPISLAAIGQQQPSQQSRKPFAVAELLLQNGAELPDLAKSPFPLGPSAKLFLEQKVERQHSTAPAATVTGSAEHVTALPPMTGMSGGMAANGSLAVQREREAKLQKRVSAGGRLMKHVEAELKRG